MTREHCVVIGNGTAANMAALTLREKSENLRITVIGQERVRYYKPHLLPDYIAGNVAQDAVFVHQPTFYKERDIKLRLGQRVVQVDFEKRRLALEHKEIVQFNGLIVACGGTPRVPEHLQVFEDVMLTLKTVADAEVWIERLALTDSVLIVGGDLTSLALTKALLSLGKKVSFVLCEDSFWPVPFTPEVREQAEKKLRDRGVQILPCNRIDRVTRIAPNRFEVKAEDISVEVGVVGAFYGLRPNVKFLARSGLGIERGILVDEYLKTRFDSVYAAGDCAQVYNPSLRDYWVSIGYENARNLGRIAALNLLGGMYRADVAAASIFQVNGIAVNTSWWTEI
jgi:NAD(P)H-nitrite reductase large subunit